MRQETCNAAVLTVTASSVISARNCVITHVSLNPAAAACTVSLYDPLPFVAGTAPTTVGATLRVTLSSPATVATPSLPLLAGAEFANGCIAVVTGAGATANVGWQVI